MTLNVSEKKKSLIKWQSIHEEDVGLPVPCRPQNSKGFCPSADKPNYISFSREDCDLGKALPPYQMLVRHQANHIVQMKYLKYNIFGCRKGAGDGLAVVESQSVATREKAAASLAFRFRHVPITSQGNSIPY